MTVSHSCHMSAIVVTKWWCWPTIERQWRPDSKCQRATDTRVSVAANGAGSDDYRLLMSADRPDERFAFDVVGRVLGVTVEEYDTAGRQNAIDALLHYPDGRAAALEVSSLGPSDEARITNVLAAGAQRRTISGLTKSWMVQIPRDFHPSGLRTVDQMLLRCEELDVTNLKHADSVDGLAEELLDAGVRMVATSAPAMEDPTVWVLTAPLGGFTDAGSDKLPAEVDTALTTDTMQSKLAASGYAEQHLFLLVRPSAFRFSVYDNLSFGGPLPSELPQLPEELSQIWLASGWGRRRRSPCDRGPRMAQRAPLRLSTTRGGGG